MNASGPRLDVQSLVAIDVHVHAESGAPGNAVDEAVRRYFGAGDAPLALDELAQYYRERHMACVVFSVDEQLSGRGVVPNEDVLAAARIHRDVMIPFASVNPLRPDAVERVRRLLAGGEVRGFKLHPPLQEFAPNDRAVYPFYEAVQESRLPVIFHTGHSGIGTGVRGGGGIRLKYGAPMLIDDVAVDFPDMPIILAHPSFPWQDEAISICLHKPQVYIDLSGWSPKYFSRTLVQYANTLLREKLLFGSDYPLITPDRWLRDFAALPIRDEVRRLILKENAIRLLGLTPLSS
jgi:predicted TIM-barrel fold metal-dependent hydrolase